MSMAILLQTEKKPTTDALIWSFTVQHNTKYTETIFIGNLKKTQLQMYINF